MKKLLCVASHFSTGGMPQVLTKRVELIKDDFDIYVIEWENLSNDFVIQKNRIKKLLEPEHFITLGEDKTQILRIIKELDIDYIHFEEMPEFFVPFNITKEIYKPDRKYKIFETTHSSDFNVDDKIFFPDKFLFVSQYNCFKFNKFGIPSEVIEYPVEKMKPTAERKSEAMKNLGLDPKFKHVVNVGLFTPRKNQAYAFEIARLLKDTNIKFHFIGNQADNFQDYWRPLMKIKPKNCIIWNERDDVNEFLIACDLFLFTSMGFRWNKELNPLVIKEALELQIPQFLFPLDVYNRKYDIEDTIHYLNGDVNIDACLIENFLFEKKNLPWKSTYLNPYPTVNKYKIRAVHLLLDGDNTDNELVNLRKYGIDYVQHINKKYTDTPPREMCARPQDVGRIGAYSLRGPHYGNYQSFKKAILTESTEDIDFLIVFESDCKLNVPMEEFVNKIFESCDYINERGIYYMSFGDDRNLRTGEIVSEDNGHITDWMHLTNKIIGIQSIMFPKFAFDFIKRSYETTLWDVSDLMFNEMFKYKMKAIAPRLTNQEEGMSSIQGGNIKHFLLKNIDSLLKDKNPNDIIVEYNKEDQKFHFCLSDFFQNDVHDISIVVNADNEKNIYKSENMSLSPYNPMWIQIYGHQNYNEFSFDFQYKDQYLFKKTIKLDGGIVPNSNKVMEEIKQVIEEKKESIIVNIPESEDFSLDFKIEENKLYLPYKGQLKDVTLNVVVKDIETKDTLFSAENLIFNNSEYCNWISTGIDHYKTNPDFCGFIVEYLRGDKIIFVKVVRLRNKKSEIIDIEANEIKTKIKNKVFVVLTYPDTKIKSDITDQCIDALKLTDTKIILSSHYPVNKNIQEKVDYYLYDSYNPLIHHTLYNFYWSTIPQGKMEIRLDNLQKKSNLNQSLTVFNNIENSIKFAKSIGYDKVICVSYDFIFNGSNLDMINGLCDRIDRENKKGYFMSYSEGDMKLYKSVFFIVNTDFYTKVFDKIVRTPEDFNTECDKNNSHNFLESYFYSKLNKYSNELIIEETNEDKLFNNSNINLFSGVEYLTVVPVKDQSNSFVLWFNSSNDKDNRRVEFTIEKNKDVENITHHVKERSYYMKKITLSNDDNCNITAAFIDSNTNVILDVQKFNINMSNYNEITNNGLFTENEIIDHKINIDFNIDLIEDNKINIWNNGDDFDGKISILDIDSRVPFYGESITIPKNTGRWVMPIPENVFNFKTAENFNGLIILLLDKNDNTIIEKNILTKEISKELNLPYMKDPLDSLYFIWKEFFIEKIYDKFLDKINIKTSMDIGANQGLFTHLLLTKGSEKVYSIEALPKCCDNLNKMFDERVTVINKAISNTNNNIDFYVNTTNTTISYSEEQISKKHLNWVYDKISVEAITINDIFEKYSIDKLDLMKVDIEGDEYEMFKNISNENLLKVDNFLIEFHHNENNDIKFILDRIKDKYYYKIEEENIKYGGTIFVSKNIIP